MSNSTDKLRDGDYFTLVDILNHTKEEWNQVRDIARKHGFRVSDRYGLYEAAKKYYTRGYRFMGIDSSGDLCITTEQGYRTKRLRQVDEFLKPASLKNVKIRIHDNSSTAIIQAVDWLEGQGYKWSHNIQPGEHSMHAHVIAVYGYSSGEIYIGTREETFNDTYRDWVEIKYDQEVKLTNFREMPVYIEVFGHTVDREKLFEVLKELEVKKENA